MGDGKRHGGAAIQDRRVYGLGRGLTRCYWLLRLGVYWNIHEPYHRMKVYETPQRRLSYFSLTAVLMMGST